MKPCTPVMHWCLYGQPCCVELTERKSDVKIELPSTLTAQVDSRWSDDAGNYVDFITLKFGSSEVDTWEWQETYPVGCRTRPDDDDVDEFIAGKIRSLFMRA